MHCAWSACKQCPRHVCVLVVIPPAFDAPAQIQSMPATVVSCGRFKRCRWHHQHLVYFANTLRAQVHNYAPHSMSLLRDERSVGESMNELQELDVLIDCFERRCQFCTVITPDTYSCAINAFNLPHERFCGWHAAYGEHKNLCNSQKHNLGNCH